jgi:hypothetical protein
MCNAKQAVVLIGPYTKNLRKFVPWEIEIAKEKHLPIVAVNLNNLRSFDAQLCPASLREYPAVHVPFRMKIIRHALDGYVSEFSMHASSWEASPRYYGDHVYSQLGIENALGASA